MSGWDGAGAFTRVYDWTDDRDGGIKILASRFDSENDTFAAGIQACLAKNGENSATANLNLGGFRFTNAGNATAATDLARVSQVQGAAYNSASAGGTADAITASLAPAITAYAEGPVYSIVPSADNATTTPTVNLNSVGATTVVKYGSQALVAGDIKANEPALITYNATNNEFELLNPASARNFVENAITDVVSDTTPQAGGTFDFNGHDIILTKGGDIASASPLVIDTDGSYFDVTGTTGFSAMTVAAGAFFALQFDGALTITHGSGITLPGGENITTVAGDQALCYATAANTVTVISYVRASVSPVPMTQAQAEAGTDTVPRPVAAAQIKQAIDALSGGGLVPIERKSSTVDASFLSFTTGIDGTYSRYIVRGWMLPATDAAALYMRTDSDGGASFDAGASDYKYSFVGDEGSGVDRVASNAATQIQFTNASIGSDADQGILFEIMFQPRSGAQQLVLAHVAYELNTDGALVTRVGGGLRNSTTIMNAFALTFTTGDVSEYDVTLYGVVNS